MNAKHIIGVFDNEDKLLKAIKLLKQHRANIIDVYGPTTNHGLIKAFTRESLLPYLSVLIGIGTIIGAFGFLYYTSVIDYPLRFGGKPLFSFPPMVVTLFLLTILVTGGLTVMAFLGRSMLFPGKEPVMIDPRASDDRFYLVMDQNFNPEEIKKWIADSGAEYIIEKEIDA
jgi:energy-coupling factor transporter transmembrane protein EcfT